MSKGEDKDKTQIRKEIAIAIFWRKRIGDYEYIKFEPDDVLRWHLTLDLRGKGEISELMAQRYKVHARKTPILGVVPDFPHPPAWIVEEWLSAQEPKFPRGGALAVVIIFLMLGGTFVPALHGCQDLQTSNTLAYKPPSHQPTMTTASEPQITTPPAWMQIPTPTYTTSGPLETGGFMASQRTGTGAPPAAAPPAGAGTVRTTPTNSGISGGAPPQ